MLKYKKDNKEELVKMFAAKHGGGDKKQVGLVKTAEGFIN